MPTVVVKPARWSDTGYRTVHQTGSQTWRQTRRRARQSDGQKMLAENGDVIDQSLSPLRSPTILGASVSDRYLIMPRRGIGIRVCHPFLISRPH